MGMYREMCKDIARERARLGGDWAISTVLDSRSIRDFVRSQLGPELEIVVLEMSLEEQMERIRGRHEGSEDAVDMMKVSKGRSKKNVFLSSVLLLRGSATP